MIRAVEPLQKEAVDLLCAPPDGVLIGDKTHRAHTGHYAPRRADARPLAQQVISQAGKGKLRGFDALLHRQRQRGLQHVSLYTLQHQQSQPGIRSFMPTGCPRQAPAGSGSRVPWGKTDAQGGPPRIRRAAQSYRSL